MILVTGNCGFIGFHLCNKLLDLGYNVIGIDNLNDYYSTKLKEFRLAELKKHPNAHNFAFYHKDIVNVGHLQNLDCIIHLAAQAGVRYAKENPISYAHSNLLGFVHIAELAQRNNCNLIYASSSSVYGDLTPPFSEEDYVDCPKSLYAATKRANELIAKTYDITTIGLRFFSIYGTFGRPDMAYWKFAKSILSGEEIYVHNNGNMARDYTHISDCVDCIVSATASQMVGHSIYNIGMGEPINLNEMIYFIEVNLGKNANVKYVPAHKEESLYTKAYIRKAQNLLGYEPKTRFEDGIKEFCDWFKASAENYDFL